MNEEKTMMFIAILTTVALVLATVMVFAAKDRLQQPAQHYFTDYKDNPYQ